MEIEKLAIGITTAPREKETLTATLRQIDKIGASEIMLFAEPFEDVFQYNYVTSTYDFKVHLSNGRLGAMKNWDRALKTLLRDTNAEYIGIFQDDILIDAATKDILRNTLRDKRDNLGFYSLFLPVNHSNIIKDTSITGWRQAFIGYGLAGACGFVFSRDSAEALLNNKGYKTHVETKTQQIDAIVAQSMLQMKKDCFWHYPSLLKHVGETSTVGHKHVAKISDALC